MDSLQLNHFEQNMESQNWGNSVMLAGWHSIYRESLPSLGPRPDHLGCFNEFTNFCSTVKSRLSVHQAR